MIILFYLHVANAVWESCPALTVQNGYVVECKSKKCNLACNEGFHSKKLRTKCTKKKDQYMWKGSVACTKSCPDLPQSVTYKVNYKRKKGQRLANVVCVNQKKGMGKWSRTVNCIIHVVIYVF